MDYQTLKKVVSSGKKIAVIGILASLPYICDDGCAILGGYAKADERHSVEQVEPSETLEKLIEE